MFDITSQVDRNTSYKCRHLHYEGGTNASVIWCHVILFGVLHNYACTFAMTLVED